MWVKHLFVQGLVSNIIQCEFNNNNILFVSITKFNRAVCRWWKMINIVIKAWGLANQKTRFIQPFFVLAMCCAKSCILQLLSNSSFLCRLAFVLLHVSVPVVSLHSSLSWCVPSVLVCNPDLFSLNRFMTLEHRCITVLCVQYRQLGFQIFWPRASLKRHVLSKCASGARKLVPLILLLFLIRVKKNLPMSDFGSLSNMD